MALLDSIAIIPARGGSKRIPNKNIKDFFGKPLIAHSIINAQESGLFKRIIVSTDSEEIAQIARFYGAEIPFLRDEHLSDDFAPTIEVIADCLERCKIGELTPVCCLYPTAPLLAVKYLKEAHQILLQSNPSYVFLASEFSFTPFRGFELENQNLKMLYPQYQFTRSQDLAKLYHDAGQFYFGLAQTFADKIPIFSEQSIPLIASNLEVQDIDTIEDFELAKLKYQLLKKSKMDSI